MNIKISIFPRKLMIDNEEYFFDGAINSEIPTGALVRKFFITHLYYRSLKGKMITICRDDLHTHERQIYE